MAKRRSRGEGTIYQRQDGLWAAQITLPNGRRSTKYARSQRAVREWLQARQHEVNQGQWSEAASTPTVAEFLERYLAEVVAHTLRPKTQETYGLLVRTHLLPAVGHLRLTALRPHHLQALYAAKLAEGKSRRTVQYLHAVIHKALSHAVKWGLAARNVSDAVDVPRPARTAPVLLSADQLRVFLEAARDDRHFALYVTAVTTGMRLGELLGLRWADVDLAAGRLSVSQVAQTVHKRGTFLAEPKTDQSRRAIALPAVTVAALQAHQARQAPLRAQERFQALDLVFPSRRGTPLTPRNLLTQFHAALARAGLPKVRFHSLRHLHATLLLQGGIHPKVVQERLGHSRIEITLDTYSHVLPGMQLPAAAAMDRLLGPDGAA